MKSPVLLPLFVTLILLTGLAVVAFSAPPSSDQQECTGPLQTLISCLGYVEGESPTPSEDCCPKLMTVHQNNPKCLCVLIQASTQGGLPGVKQINSSLALRLPGACKVPADPKRCPGLLGISPSSPEARVFETSPGTNPQGGNATPASPASGGGSAGGSGGSGGGKPAGAGQYSNGSTMTIISWFPVIVGAIGAIVASCPL